MRGEFARLTCFQPPHPQTPLALTAARKCTQRRSSTPIAEGRREPGIRCKYNSWLDRPREGGKGVPHGEENSGTAQANSAHKRLSSRDERQDARPRCGLCGATGNLTRTNCCGQWICDDEDQYVIFSYARNSCSRNHRRYTLCAHHSDAGHEGTWQDCLKCRAEFGTEMYVYRGTNEYNFKKLTKPPAFEPTSCTQCGKRINLGEGGWSYKAGQYRCLDCVSPAIQAIVSRK